MAFFYWLQAVSGWDETAAVDSQTLEYYRSFIPQHDVMAKNALHNVRNILRGCSDPRKLLGDIYAGDVSSNEAQELHRQASHLRPYFDAVWAEQYGTLKKWEALLEDYDFARFDESLAKITRFLDSSFNLELEQTIYLLPNAPGKSTIGHRISGRNFLLVRPPIDYNPDQLNSLVGVIIHEIIHAIEFESKTTRAFMKRAYDTYIQPYDIPAPAGYTWKAMFLEAIVYCFANNITGGYLRPQIFGKARPTTDEFEQKANRFFAQNGLKTGHVLAWIGLCILPLVDELMGEGGVMNQEVFDMAGREFRRLKFQSRVY